MGLAAYGNGRMSGRVLWLDNLGRLVTDMRLLADSSVPYRDLAHVVQTQTSSVLIELLGLLKNRTLASVLYYSGGVALNVVSNEDLIRSGLFDTVHMNGPAKITERRSVLHWLCIGTRLGEGFLSAPRSTTAIGIPNTRSFCSSDDSQLATKSSAPPI